MHQTKFFVFFLGIIFPCSFGRVSTHTIRTCEGPATFDHGHFDPIKTSYKPGDQLRFECDRSFELRGDPVVACNRNGQWLTEFPVCEIKCTQTLCYPPEVFPNGKMEPKRAYYLPGDGLWFECNENHVLSGGLDVFCQENGEWFPEIPSCEVRTCHRLQAPNDGSLHPVKDVYHVNDIVTFTCGPGFELKGLPELLCIPGGWIDYPPTCKGRH